MREDLAELYREIFADNQKPSMSQLDLLAEMLSAAVGRERPWTGKFLHSILAEHRGYTEYRNSDLTTAIAVVRVTTLKGVEAVVLSNGLLSTTSLPPGTLILGDVVKCECGILFVPRWGNQKYHTHGCRRQARNRRRRELRRRKAHEN